MKKILLTGAMLIALSFSVNAQSCAQAVSVTDGEYTVSEYNGEYFSGCFAPPTDPVLSPEATAAAWYTYTATANGAVRINTNLLANTGGDTRVAVYTGTCTALECWTSADDIYFVSEEDANYLTDFQFPVLEGQTYYIAFDNKWEDEGFNFELTFMAPGCSSTALDEKWTNSASYYFCWNRINAASQTAGSAWSLYDTYDFGGESSFPDSAVGINAPTRGVNNDFLISNGVNLTAGTEYSLNVVYNGLNFVNAAGVVTREADESFEVVVFTYDEENGFTPVGDPIGEETGISGTEQLFLVDDAVTGTYAFTPEANGEYHFGIRSTSEAGGTVLFIFEISLDGLAGLDGQLASNFKVYPNPSSNVVNVNSANALVNAVNFTDLNGRIVKSAKFNGVADAQVNISDLASGVYMMNISSDKGTTVKKIVKN
jgi:hypothetical protein